VIKAKIGQALLGQYIAKSLLLGGGAIRKKPVAASHKVWPAV
jgi:hypothetical protein